MIDGCGKGVVSHGNSLIHGCGKGVISHGNSLFCGNQYVSWHGKLHVLAVE